MDSSVSGKDEIWFLGVCHHVPHELYLHNEWLEKHLRKPYTSEWHVQEQILPFSNKLILIFFLSRTILIFRAYLVCHFLLVLTAAYSSGQPGQMIDRSPIVTDHTYIDMKLTDIGWPTKIVLPSIRDYNDDATMRAAPNICRDIGTPLAACMICARGRRKELQT